MKKKVIIGVSIFLVLIVASFIGLFVFYNISLSPVGNNENKVFIIESKTPSISVITNLKKEGLIKNDFTAKIYAKLNNKSSFQAGKYELNTNMSVKEIFDKLVNGNVINDNISVTFVEGKRLLDYVKVISDKFSFSEKDILNKLKDKEFLQGLINKYWFVTDDILNSKIYYPLEGYLYPDTYQFSKDATLEDVIIKLVSTLGNKLEPYKEKIENSDLSVHEIITLASIVELEAATESDRKDVAGVFYNRLKLNMTLGSDVTTYYAAQISFQDNVGPYLNQCNAYNTRGNCVPKLPIGPISSPSITSLSAAIEPNDNEYLYFVSDANKKVYFAKNDSEQNKNIKDIMSRGLWLE